MPRAPIRPWPSIGSADRCFVRRAPSRRDGSQSDGARPTRHTGRVGGRQREASGEAGGLTKTRTELNRTAEPSEGWGPPQNEVVKRRTDVVGIFPSEVGIVRLIGAVPLEANDERAMTSGRSSYRYMQVEAVVEPLAPPLIEGEATPTPADDTRVTPQAA